MVKIVYEIAEHDGGWAYRVDGAWSETFGSHDAARKAAERAAREQAIPGDDIGITYTDKDGLLHAEIASGRDRPDADVKG